jgi:hypothetical protein
LEIKKFYPKSAQKRFWVCVEGKIKLHQKSTQILLLIMFLTTRMNFMIIGHDLGLLGEKILFGKFLGIFEVVSLSTSKYSPGSVRLEWKFTKYFCMGNP